MIDLRRHLEDAHVSLSPTMRQASSYIQQNLSDIAFQPIRNLAKLTGVSPLTIIRLTRKWGFEGYPDFQKAVRASLFEVGSFAQTDTPTDTGVHDIDSCVKDAAALINKARSVHIAGSRSARAFALYMNYMGRMVYDHFHLMLPAASITAEDLAQLSTDDLLIGFSTRPYATETVRLFQAAHVLQIPTIAITDDFNSPLAAEASVTIIVPVAKKGRLYQMAPVITVIEQILETSFTLSDVNADGRITHFADRVNAIRGYWQS